MSKRGPQMQVERIEKRFKNDESPKAVSSKAESPKAETPRDESPAESKEVEKLADEAVEKLGEAVQEAVSEAVEEIETQNQNSPNETQLSPESLATINLIDEKLDKLLAEIVQRITDQANETKEDVTTNSDTDSDMPPLVADSDSDSDSEEEEEEEEEEVESECESEACGCHDKEVVQVSCTFSEVPSFVKVFAFAYLVIHGLNLYFSATSCN
jgi:rRNA-processing protein EBP2